MHLREALVNHRKTLILRLYRQGLNADGCIAGVCEDPDSGSQHPFRTEAELWAIVRDRSSSAGCSPGARARKRKNEPTD